MKGLLEQEVTCSVCLDVYEDPRELQCGHSFCVECVRSLVCSASCGGGGDGGVLKCPECRAVSELDTQSANGVYSLPKDRTLVRMLTIFNQLNNQQHAPTQPHSTNTNNTHPPFHTQHIPPNFAPSAPPPSPPSSPSSFSATAAPYSLNSQHHHQQQQPQYSRIHEPQQQQQEQANPRARSPASQSIARAAGTSVGTALAAAARAAAATVMRTVESVDTVRAARGGGGDVVDEERVEWATGIASCGGGGGGRGGCRNAAQARAFFAAWFESRWFLPREFQHVGTRTRTATAPATTMRTTSMHDISLLLAPVWIIRARVSIQFNATAVLTTTSSSSSASREDESTTRGADSNAEDRVVHHSGRHCVDLELAEVAFSRRDLISTQHNDANLLACLGFDSSGACLNTRTASRLRSCFTRLNPRTHASVPNAAAAAGLQLHFNNNTNDTVALTGAVDNNTRSQLPASVSWDDARARVSKRAHKRAVDSLTDKLKRRSPSPSSSSSPRSSLLEWLARERVTDVKINVEHASVALDRIERVLLPVWTATYSCNNSNNDGNAHDGEHDQQRARRVYINAVTGSVIGSRPWDVRRIAHAVLVAAAGAGVGLLVFASLAMRRAELGDDNTSTAASRSNS